MEKSKGITNCNGCEACVVACKKVCIKTEIDENGVKHPIVNLDGCTKCNNCRLYCPLYFPVELPEFKEYFEYKDEFYDRDMGTVYRETMRKVKSGEHTEFVGTLCQIAALKALLGDKLPQRLFVFPLICDQKNPKREACVECQFYK